MNIETHWVCATGSLFQGFLRFRFFQFSKFCLRESSIALQWGVLWLATVQYFMPFGHRIQNIQSCDILLSQITSFLILSSQALTGSPLVIITIILNQLYCSVKLAGFSTWSHFSLMDWKFHLILAIFFNECISIDLHFDVVLHFLYKLIWVG